ncbi:MAG: LysM peptidoglycan-binding domain-containing protein [Acidimicrobiales bacterium]
MSPFAPITVRQPQPFDIVDDPVRVCGIGTGFEATFNARVRDGAGTELANGAISAGLGNGALGNFHAELPLGTVPPTAWGTVEVFESSAEDGSELNKVVVPVTFGRALVDPYGGFLQYTVEPGDTLAAIARQFYGDTGLWPRLFEANRNQIHDPDLIFAGQVLRVPQ